MAMFNSAALLLPLLFSLVWACIPTISPDEDDLYTELSSTTSMLIQYSTSTLSTTLQSTGTTPPATTATTTTTSESTTSQTTTTTPSTTTTTTSLMCLSGWTGNPANGFCYLPYMTDMRFFSSAEMLCVAMGGHLVSIENQAENDFVLMLAASVSPPNSLYLIGLSAAMGSDTYTWTDTTPFDPMVYNNYENGVAPGPNTFMRCIAMYVNYPVPMDGKWTFTGCAPAYAPTWFICKAPAMT